MKTYARLNDKQDRVEALVDISDEHAAALADNPKMDFLRLYVVAPKPTPSATQVVEDDGYVIEANAVRRTWRVRDKTAPELAAEAEQAEQQADYAQLRTVLGALSGGTGTQAERIRRCELVLSRLLKDRLKERE